MRTPIGIIAAVTTALTLILAPGTASADPWGTVRDRNGVPIHPDGEYHWWCMWTDGAWGIPQNMQDNADAATRDALGNRTQATVRRDSECDLVADDGRTDTVFEEIYLEEGVLGETWCHERWPQSHQWAGYCDRVAAVLNQQVIDENANNDESQYTKTACHELGHSVGLSHYPDDPPGNGHDCMRSGIWDNGDIAYRTYNGHHVGHLNDWFDEQ
ncbi:hypothetical protein ACH35V_02385 [Actinomadura sp. 1N219]|uniref:hypothetical protein n=1 Tax=Actinomadura sp. 1N219 TaxID=3375152 RepID=UPI00378F135E